MGEVFIGSFMTTGIQLLAATRDGRVLNVQPSVRSLLLLSSINGGFYLLFLHDL